jgi:hypothetical protein
LEKSEFFFSHVFVSPRDCEKKLIFLQEMQEELKLSKYQALVSIVINNDGCIFGGFLRDYAMQKTPKDLDAIVYYSNLFQLDTELKAIGYTTMDDLEDDELEYNCDEKLPIHVIVESEEADQNVRLTPCPIPDYDVNLLALDKSGLFNWMDLSDPSIIIRKIHNRVASAINPSEDRIAKFKLMGFTEIPYQEPKKMVTSYQVCEKELITNKIRIKRARKSIEESEAAIKKAKQDAKESEELIKKAKQYTEESNQKTKRIYEEIEEMNQRIATTKKETKNLQEQLTKKLKS